LNLVLGVVSGGRARMADPLGHPRCSPAERCFAAAALLAATNATFKDAHIGS